jgi:hypothetical protein
MATVMIYRPALRPAAKKSATLRMNFLLNTTP